LLTAAFGLVLIEGLYWLIWLAGPYWVPAAAVGAFAVAAGLGQLAPVLILPLFYKIERLDDPSLAQRLGRLCEGTGLTIEGAYRMRLSSETVKANAMLAGLGRTRRVIVGDTLLERFTPDEVEVVFAHELGHHLHRHIPKLLLAALAYSGASFWLCDRVLAWRVASLEGAMRYAALPVHTLPLLLLTIAAFSLLLQPLKNALGRRFERQSDRYALQRTGMCEAFLSAFRKLAKLNKANPNPHPLETLLFHDHPPIAERLAMAEKFRKS
jgi:STE24 endopeptidase